MWHSPRVPGGRRRPHVAKGGCRAGGQSEPKTGVTGCSLMQTARGVGKAHCYCMLHRNLTVFASGHGLQAFASTSSDPKTTRAQSTPLEDRMFVNCHRNLRFARGGTTGQGVCGRRREGPEGCSPYTTQCNAARGPSSAACILQWTCDDAWNTAVNARAGLHTQACTVPPATTHS